MDETLTMADTSIRTKKHAECDIFSKLFHLSKYTCVDEVYSIQQYMIQFVSDLRQVGCFSGTPISSTNKTDHHDITEILMKVALNTINLN